MIKIICVGKIKEKYLEDFINDYKMRISKYTKIEIIELKDSNINDESTFILKNINEKDYNIALCLQGKKVDSYEFSKIIDKSFTNGYSKVTYIIGGSDGLSSNVLDKCNLKLSFSDLTFPHQVFRAILLEQIYRSFKILNNESYHK